MKLILLNTANPLFIERAACRGVGMNGKLIRIKQRPAYFIFSIILTHAGDEMRAFLNSLTHDKPTNKGITILLST